MSRLDVQQCIVSTAIRQYGPNPTSDLLGVDYFYTVPADTEFPRTIKLELFARFFGIDQSPTWVFLTVMYLSQNGSDREEVYRKRFDLPFLNQSGRVVLDRGFKLMNVLLVGEGEYAVRVLRPRRQRRQYNTGSKWQESAEWRILAADYFAVGRA
jgi:hypothetical protein